MAGNGQILTTSDTVTTKRSVADYVNMIDPQDVPCVSYFGTNNGGRFRIVNLPNHKYAWLEDTLKVRTTAVNNGAGYDDNDTSIVVDDSTIFKPGDVIQIGTEKLWVSDVNYTTHALTVERGWGSTSGAAMLDNATVEYLFSARLEGDESDPSYYTTPSEVYNQSQIFHWEIKVSGSEQDAVARYGIPDTYKYQMMKALGGLGGGNGQRGRAGDLMIDLEKTFFRGERIARTSSVAGAMGGAKSFISTNVTDLNGDPLSEEVFLDAVQDCWSQGGKPRAVVLNAFNKRLINSWYAPLIDTSRTERTGGSFINRIETDFGTLDIILNRWCPADEVYILEKEYVGWITLRNWFVEDLAKTGDYVRSEIIGEFGFVLQNEKAHALIHDTATSL